MFFSSSWERKVRLSCTKSYFPCPFILALFRKPQKGAAWKDADKGLSALNLNATLFLSVLLQQISVAITKFFTLGLKLQKCCLHVIYQVHVLREGTRVKINIETQNHVKILESKCSQTHKLTPFLDRCSASLLTSSAGSAGSSGYLMNPEILDEQNNIKSSL